MEIHLQTTDHVVAVEKVAEQHIGTKLCSSNTFEDISHLLIHSYIYCIPGRKSGILRIQYGHAAAAEISFWTR